MVLVVPLIRLILIRVHLSILVVVSSRITRGLRLLILPHLAVRSEAFKWLLLLRLEFLVLILIVGLIWSIWRGLSLLNLFLWLEWLTLFRNERLSRNRWLETSLRHFQCGGLSLCLELLLVSLLLNVGCLGIWYLLVSPSFINSCHWFSFWRL